MLQDIPRIVQLLRACAKDFRDARKLPGKQGDEFVADLLSEVDSIVGDAWMAGFLRSITPLVFECEKAENRANADKSNYWEFLFSRSVFDTLVDYRSYEYISDVDIHPSDYDEDTPVENGKSHIFLAPGLLSKVGHKELQSIYLGSTPQTDDETLTRCIESQYQIFGYFSLACNIIADIIEREQTSLTIKTNEAEQSSELNDGLYRASALFVWEGKTYEGLSDQMMIALELLYRANLENRNVERDEMEIGIGHISMDGFKRIFRVDRDGWPSVHPVESIVGGRANRGWYLKKLKS
ncbi:MAG: hypothetical protein SGI77_18400 [Pirellulaceae bacterium]|nr:hypothetical protein [Pirellulaceae bacterium]